MSGDTAGAPQCVAMDRLRTFIALNAGTLKKCAVNVYLMSASMAAWQREVRLRGHRVGLALAVPLKK